MMHIWPGQIWELWATFRPFKGEETTRVVAVFLSEKSAAEYLKKSHLAKKGYRKISLLHGASEAWIEEAEEFPIEPTL